MSVSTEHLAHSSLSSARLTESTAPPDQHHPTPLTPIHMLQSVSAPEVSCWRREIHLHLHKSVKKRRVPLFKRPAYVCICVLWTDTQPCPMSPAWWRFSNNNNIMTITKCNQRSAVHYVAGTSCNFCEQVLQIWQLDHHQHWWWKCPFGCPYFRYNTLQCPLECSFSGQNWVKCLLGPFCAEKRWWSALLHDLSVDKMHLCARQLFAS